MKNTTRGLIIFFMALLFTDSSNAQYEIDKHYVGPSIGLSFLGSTAQLGLNHEYAFMIEDFGIVGAGGIFRYWNYEESYSGGTVTESFTNFLIGGQFNYHFKAEINKIDPFLGLVLAYNMESSNGGVWFGFQGGARYWITPNIAIMGRGSFGTLSYGALELGVDFKL